jgi:hypothetical protein
LEATCQRCHEPLRQADRYCSVCGLPQLVYLEVEPPPLPFGANDGSVVPVSLLDGSATGIAWKSALRASILLSIPTGFLFFELAPLSVLLSPLLMGGASAWAVALYGKRTHLARISMGAGARIGLITGIFVSWLVFSANGVSMWGARFLQHRGGQMDAQFLADMDASQRWNQQLLSQVTMTSVEAAQSAQMSLALRNWMLTPEGRAAAVLLTLLVVTAFLIFFSTIGGAVGARFLGRSMRQSRTPAA